MSTAAALWTHNEPDILLPNLRYLLGQVDEVIVRDRASETDTKNELELLRDRSGGRLVLEEDDGRFEFRQPEIMTDLAMVALERGHQWVIPIDPDEIWYANGATLKDYLAGLSRDTGIVSAELYNHVASLEDDATEPNPFRRIGWRQRHPLPLPKMCARTRPDLMIEGGNHSIRTEGVALVLAPGLVIRHFPYRSEDLFIERVRSNYAELKKSNLPEGYGAHVRSYGRTLEEQGEEALRSHFRHWFISDDPRTDDTLIYDPVPWM